MPQMSQVLRECAIGMMTAGMSSKAVELNVNLSTMSRLQRRFREFGSTSNLVTTPAQDLHIQHLHLQDQPLQQSVCIIKVFLQKLSETVSGKLICMLVFLIVVSTWLQFVIVTNLFSSQMNPGFHCTGEMADSVYGVVWVTGLLMSTLSRVANGGSGVMVQASVCYGQRTQVHFIDGILNAQRNRDEILGPIVVPFIHDHHLMLQHDLVHVSTFTRPDTQHTICIFMEVILQWISFLSLEDTHTLTVSVVLFYLTPDLSFSSGEVVSYFLQCL